MLSIQMGETNSDNEGYLISSKHKFGFQWESPLKNRYYQMLFDISLFHLGWLYLIGRVSWLRTPPR